MPYPKSKPLRAVGQLLSLSGFFCDAPHLMTSDKKFLVIRGHSRPLNPKPEWEIRQVCPIRAFSLSRPNLPPSDKKFLVIRQTSTSANELSHQWAVRSSTAHRLEIRRALYLQPSDKKLGLTLGRVSVVSLVPSDS